MNMTEKNNLKKRDDDLSEIMDSKEEVMKEVKEQKIDEETYQELSEFFKTLSNVTRLKIISLLSLKDLHVSEICEILNLNQTTVSNQLRILRANNIVKYEKEGQMVRYSLTYHHIELIYKIGLEHALEEK